MAQARGEKNKMRLAVDAAMSAQTGTAPFEFAHLVGAYWAFALSGVHLGLNWRRVVVAARRARGAGGRSIGGARGSTDAGPGAMRPPRAAAAFAPAVIALLGLLAFFKRGAWRYLLGLAHYVLMDYAEPAWIYIADYLLIGSLFVVIGRIAGAVARKLAKTK